MYSFGTDKSNKSPVEAYLFLSTVKCNKSHFSRREIEGEDRDRDLQEKCMSFPERPSKHHFQQPNIRHQSYRR